MLKHEISLMCMNHSYFNFSPIKRIWRNTHVLLSWEKEKIVGIVEHQIGSV